MKSLNTSEINLEFLIEAFQRIIDKHQEMNITNPNKIFTNVYQYLVHLEAQKLIKDFAEPIVIPNARNGIHLEVKVAMKRWHTISLDTTLQPGQPTFDMPRDDYIL